MHGSTVVRSWTVSAARAGSTTWQGTDAAGHAVADGRYTFRVTGRDAAGNLTVSFVPLTVDRTVTTVRWSRPAYYPQDGDAISATSRVSFSLTRSAVVTVAIYSGATPVRTVWTGRTLAAGSYGWTWNGKDQAGLMVARGTYRRPGGGRQLARGVSGHEIRARRCLHHDALCQRRPGRPVADRDGDLNRSAPVRADHLVPAAGTDLGRPGGHLARVRALSRDVHGVARRDGDGHDPDLGAGRRGRNEHELEVGHDPMTARYTGRQ